MEGKRVVWYEQTGFGKKNKPLRLKNELEAGDGNVGG